jgi:PleD family two-component response regulator
MKLLRDVIERSVDARLASAIIFEALSSDRASEVPTDMAALHRFIEGPLRTALSRRLGSAPTSALLDAIEAELLAPDEEDDRNRTREWPIGAGPVVVLVVSRSASLAVALRAALGGERIGLRTAADAPAVESAAKKIAPDLVIIDATEPIRDMPSVADAIRAVPASSSCLHWGRETPWGLRFGVELDRRGVAFTPVDRTHGVDPLLDLVRSRLG